MCDWEVWEQDEIKEKNHNKEQKMSRTWNKRCSC